MEQTYTPENDIAFIDSVIPFFRDSRYIRVNGAPMLIVYRPQHMPDARLTAERWRRHCREIGIGEIHLVAALTHGNDDFEQFGFDAGVEFPPHNLSNSQSPPRNLAHKVKAPRALSGSVWDYAVVARALLSHDYASRRVYRCVFPSWDNSARVGTRALVIQGGTPGNYERWLDGASHLTVAERAPSDRIVFINAWNEWAEGCHLEPDRAYGRGYLEATKRVKEGHSVADTAWEPALGQFAAASASESPPANGAAPPNGSRQVRIAIRTAAALARYPGVYRAVRSAYRATLKK